MPSMSSTTGTPLGNARATVERLTTQSEAGGLPEEATNILRELTELLTKLTVGQPEASTEAEARPTLFFDVSDLLGYFPYNRLPTGIQRVQISIILNLMDLSEDWKIAPCCFVERLREWREVPTDAFRSLCAMSLIDGDTEAADWRSEYAQLERAVAAEASLLFPDGACLVNLGTSWWLPDYFSCIRLAKAASGVRYIPLIHDVIPAIMPEYCNDELVHEFIDWLIGVIQHADFYLAVSESTKRDLIALAMELGVTIPETRVAVVPLAAELHHVGPTDGWRRVPLARWGLKPGGYAMFVSTIEARKNQLGAFDAWQTLIGTHGKDRVPTLVCIGKRGFQSEVALDRLNSNPDLRDRVVILDRVDDTGLEALYRQCLFTIYPSLYEGWGLPVTESLAYGKVPVVADNSSLPQASGGFSVQFETGSQTAFVSALEKIAFDGAFRRNKESAIASSFVPRTWAQVAVDVERAVESVHNGSANARASWSAPVARPGYYQLVRNREVDVRQVVGSAELFRKGGSGWWRLEDFGSWTRPAGGELLMRLDPAIGNVALQLRGLSQLGCSYTVSADDGTILASGKLPANVTRWLILDIPNGRRSEEVSLRIASAETEIVRDHVTNQTREIGVGVCAFFVFDPNNPRMRLDFLEALALDNVKDHIVDTLRVEQSG